MIFFAAYLQQTKMQEACMWACRSVARLDADC
ncbi:Acb2/Tad1 domain-containing protein [Klebsiella grimontii]